MNKWAIVAFAGVAGAAVSAVYNYLFAPAPETTFDGSYQSRLDWAIAEGEKAAALRELELRAEFEAAKQPQPQLPTLPPVTDLPSGTQKGGITKS
jgi:hypothetical protein